MANYFPKTEHLKDTQWQRGVSGNITGKPKGTKHLSRWIKEMLEDEEFELKLKDGTVIKGAPIKAIVGTLIVKSINGDMRAFDLLGKYGYGTKVEILNDDKVLPMPILGGNSVHIREDS